MIRVLELWLKINGISPLTPMHVAGVKNVIIDTPYSSFGSDPKWHCKNDTDLLHIFNQKFPLPGQASWTVFRPSKAISMRFISVLHMEAYSIKQWRRLLISGKHNCKIGTSSLHLWEWTYTYRSPDLKSKSDASQDSMGSPARILWSRTTYIKWKSSWYNHVRWKEDHYFQPGKPNETNGYGTFPATFAGNV